MTSIQHQLQELLDRYDLTPYRVDQLLNQPAGTTGKWLAGSRKPGRMLEPVITKYLPAWLDKEAGQ